MTRTRWTMVTLCAFALLLLPVGVGQADTPDGETPAEETICDPLKGGTPGLYGLCVAFCEAHDCEPDFSEENPLENCRPGSKKVLERYEAKRAAGDPDMPCLAAGACPCFTQDELDSIPLLGTGLYAQCDDMPPITNIVTSFSSDLAQVDERPGSTECFFFQTVDDGVSFRVLPLTPEEAVTCRDLLVSTIASSPFCP